MGWGLLEVNRGHRKRIMDARIRDTNTSGEIWTEINPEDGLDLDVHPRD